MTDQETYQAKPDAPPAPAMPALPNEPYYQSPPARRGRNAGLGIALVVVGLVLLAFQSFGRAVPFGGTYKLVDQELRGTHIELVAGNSDVEVRAWDGATIKIEAIQRGGGRGDYQVNVEQRGDTVHIAEDTGSWFCFFCSRGISYRIDVPKSAAASLQVGSGTIDIAGLGGAVTLATTSGDIHADDLGGGLTVNTTSGEVRLSAIRGPLRVETISGDVQLGEGAVDGATVSTTSGEIDLDGVGGDLALSTRSGDITVRDAKASQLDLSTTSGEISYDGALVATGESKVSTISGDVDLKLPEDSSFALNASTISGDISSEFELAGAEDGQRSLSGAVGSGGQPLTVETTSGDISLDRR